MLIMIDQLSSYLYNYLGRLQDQELYSIRRES